MDINCEDVEDGTCKVTYCPTEPGNYIINIKFADKHVPGGDRGGRGHVGWHWGTRTPGSLLGDQVPEVAITHREPLHGEGDG